MTTIKVNNKTITIADKSNESLSFNDIDKESKSLESLALNISKSVEALNIVSNIKAIESFGYKSTEGVGERIKAGAKAVWDRIKQFFIKIGKFFKDLIKFIMNFIRSAYSNVKSIFTKRRNKNNLSQNIKSKVLSKDFNNLSKENYSVFSTEGDGNNAAQHKANIAMYNKRQQMNSPQITEDEKINNIYNLILNFMSSNGVGRIFERPHNYSQGTYSLVLLIMYLDGKKDIMDLMKGYDEELAKYNSNLNEILKLIDDPSYSINEPKEVYDADRFLTFADNGHFETVTYRPSQIAKEILDMYETDKPEKISNEAINLMQSNTSKLNSAINSTDNLIKTLNEIISSSSFDKYDENTRYYLHKNVEYTNRFKDLTVFVLNEFKFAIKFGCNVESLFIQIDKELQK